MTPFGKITSTAGALITVLCLLCSTGCAKEELTPPNAPVPVHKSATASDVSQGIVHSTDSGITDDGDDQGDKEHSNSSKP
jgi:hypothetical protein